LVVPLQGSAERTLIVPPHETPPNSMAEYLLSGGEPTPDNAAWASEWLEANRNAMKR